LPSSKLRRSGDSNNHIEEFHLEKRDGQTVNAHNVEKEVAIISRPRDRVLGTDFVYDDTAGTGQTVYIIDTGAGLANADVGFLISKDQRQWLTNDIGVLEIRYSEQKIPPSLRCSPERSPGK